MWSSKKQQQDQEKVIGETNDGKLITFSEIYNIETKLINITILKQLMKEGLKVLKELSKGERHKVYSCMSYDSGITFEKIENNEIQLFFRDPNEYDSDDELLLEENKEEKEKEEEEEEKEKDEDEEEEIYQSESKYDYLIQNINDKYNKMCGLVVISCSVNILFYLLMITTDPVRLIDTKHCFT